MVKGKPIPVLVLTGLYVIAGIWAVMVGIFIGNPLYTLVLLLAGVLDFAVAYGLYSGQRWAWVVAMVFTTLAFIALAVNYIRNNTINYIRLVMDTFIAVMLIHSAGYYGVEIPFLPTPKPETAACVNMEKNMKFFKRL